MLVVSDVIVSWFSVPLTEFDAAYFNCPIGDSKGQQVWEALAILVALRFWRSSWLGTRPVLEVKSDNVAALTLLATLKSSPTSNVVAREIALDIALGSFQPDIISHSPGVSAIVVDSLSRRYQPGV